MQVTCPQNPRLPLQPLERRSPNCRDPFQNYRLINYYNASDLAEIRADISADADNSAIHLVTFAGSRAAIFEIILISSKIQIANRNWHVRCCDHFAYYEICNKRVHKRETAMNSGEVMMSNACQVGRGVRKPEASNGAMNMSRYISKSVLLLTLSVVIAAVYIRCRHGSSVRAFFTFRRITACLPALTVKLLVRASARSFLLRTNIFSLARPPRLTMHQLRPRRQWLHRTTSLIRVATSVPQRIHLYSAQLKGSAVFTIVDDVDGGFAQV